MGPIDEKNYFCPPKFYPLEMSKKKNQSDDQLVAVEEALSKTEQFVEKNQNNLLIGLIAVVVLVGGYFAYMNLYKKPYEQEAQEAILFAQLEFERDSFRLALNGNEKFYGFETMIDEYGSTKAGKLSYYYAGVCYAKLGEYANAIEKLDKFKSDDEMLAAVRLGLIGDCFAELNQPEEALEYYEKASKARRNDFTTPFYLKKAAETSMILNNPAKALKLYETIKKDFPKSLEAQDIDRLIERARFQAQG
jgi:tetratricopeptide (TPR) repeat protein